ncbi:MAG: hypothetical protein CMG75_10680 [Candidatus Marinimicrobia bacterium]|nr:hypothetical protein [Candidatus Neomarinimicrobiota bacterium]|tara:strand:+ start:785 stop:1918 length:1134 start_codon:yes stop_codon:yes gene_type:complete
MYNLNWKDQKQYTKEEINKSVGGSVVTGEIFKTSPLGGKTYAESINVPLGKSQEVKEKKKKQFNQIKEVPDRLKKFKSLRYPSEFIHEDQDCIQFQIFRYERGSKKIQGLSVTGEKDAPKKLREKTQNSRLVGGPKKLLTNKLGTILLPIPAAIADTNAANYGESKLNDFYAGAIGSVDSAMGAENIKGFMGALAQGGKDLAGELTNPQTRKALNSWLAAQAVGMAGANISPEQLMMRQSAQMINPNMEMLFSGPSVRSFQFTFKFTPRNQEESDEVKQIIRQFKQNMMPRLKGTYLKSPNMFEISYRKGAAMHPFLNRFKLCALTNCSTNYTADGNYSTYHDGTPISMSINLGFQELTPVYNEDYDNADGAIGVGY